MDEKKRFRVLEKRQGSVLLNPISEKQGECDSVDESPISVTISETNPEIAEIVPLLDPGHIVLATFESTDNSRRFESIEHRGGCTIVELDSHTIPYVLRPYSGPSNSPEGDERRRTVLSLADDAAVSESPNSQIGEAVLTFPQRPVDDAWNAFLRGDGSEEVYGQFETLDGSPSEVLIGNPAGEDYWYALLFEEDRTPLARRIRAQDGYLYDDRYVANPDWDLSILVNSEKLGDVDEYPESLLNPEYDVNPKYIPDRFGKKTVDLIAELLWVGSQFDVVLSPFDSEDIEPHRALEYSPVDIPDTIPSLMTTYQLYTSLLSGIYRRVEEHPEASIDDLLEDGAIPEPEVFYRSELLLEAHVHSLESYFDKMRRVPIEEYVISPFSGGPPIDVSEIPGPVDTSSLSMVIERALFDMEQNLDEMKQVLEVGNYIVDVEERDDRLRYDIELREKVYYFVRNQMRSRIDHIVPAEMGGEDPGVFGFLVGRLARRHDWIDVNSLGPMGPLLDSFDG